MHRQPQTNLIHKNEMIEQKRVTVLKRITWGMIGGASFLCKRPSQSNPWNHLQKNHNKHGYKQAHILNLIIKISSRDTVRSSAYSSFLLPYGRVPYILTVVWDDEYDKTLTYFFGCRWFRFCRIPVFRPGCLDTTFWWGRRHSFLSSVEIRWHRYLSG